jgi:hypothetical protein
MRLLQVLLILVQVLCYASIIFAAETNPPTALSGITLDMQWFLSYMSEEENGISQNEFKLKRGYVNIKKKINESFSGRITTDLTTDKEGDGEGDVEIRLKYMYLKYKMSGFGFFNKAFFEFGLVHRPWIDFEQQINSYRIEGQMYLERNKVVSSGDNGIFFSCLLGDELGEEYRRTVNKRSAGKYGSLAVGIYNGGGYHALEKNNNKTIEYRLSLRPVHQLIPGLQMTFHGAIGKGNTVESPNWTYNSAFLSYESARLILTSQYFTGDGNYKGSALDNTVDLQALPQAGYSFFAEVKFWNSRISSFARYDSFTKDYSDNSETLERKIFGVAYNFLKNSKIVLDYNISGLTGESSDSKTFEIALELKY